MQSIKDLNVKVNSIKIKSKITKNDLIFIDSKILQIRNFVKDKQINEDINNLITSVLINTVRTVLSSPTTNDIDFQMKKKFLSVTPDILNIDEKHYPKSYTKRYISSQQTFF